MFVRKADKLLLRAAKTKFCYECKIEKSASEFYRHKSGRLSGLLMAPCAACKLERSKKANLENPQQFPLREYTTFLKAHTPCADCKHCFHPCAMDFDHVHGQKKAEISKLCNTASLEELKAEIEKCEIVCSNCHRVRTLTRNLSRRSVLQTELLS